MIAHDVATDTLLRSAKEIFETMVFMAIEGVDTSAFDTSGEDSLLGTITFNGDQEGCFAFCCDDVCARNVAASMLCMEADEEIAAQDINDAIGEIVNMVMGSVKSGEPTFNNVHVSIPTVVRGREIEHNLGERASELISCVKLGGQHVAELSLLWRSSE